ncbi:hypothetical protein [Chitinibacter sp. GC72]|uniref:hypothetical protein n=1 Tax=Chitinibacter sp. GC72 TaxID=1526917 RepID=UPI0012F90F96|nr:hypothetical protein [Chitinibacter sp. GC72]
MSVKDIIGLVADMMTLFGLSGFFTWAFVRRRVEGQAPSEIGVSVFALAVKCFISVAAICLLLIPACLFHVFVIMVISGHYGIGDALWNDQKILAYSASYILNCLWFIPMSILAISSVFMWSLDPFRRFYRVLTSR